MRRLRAHHRELRLPPEVSGAPVPSRPCSVCARSVWPRLRMVWRLSRQSSATPRGPSWDGRHTLLTGPGSACENVARVIQQQPLQIRKAQGTDPTQACYKVPGTVTDGQAFRHRWALASQMGSLSRWAVQLFQGRSRAEDTELRFTGLLAGPGAPGEEGCRRHSPATPSDTSGRASEVS